MKNSPILAIRKLGFQWETQDPFLFCVHHLDHYPAGNDEFGPAASLTGRNIGQDFTTKDGWRMYHGETVPGFPAHPHRGFETVTVVLKGFVDHSDSHGSEGRYGDGDVQWMTAGSGLQHAEMFPLLDKNNPNLMELFQIWINLPKAKKFASPFYKMLWSEEIPEFSQADEKSKKTEITVIAGKIEEVVPPAPAPDSWAFPSENDVAIWIIKMEAGAVFTLPPASIGINRSLYFYRGSEVAIAGTILKPMHSAELKSDESVLIENGDQEGYLLLLQGKPIAEPVVQHGPFVMNSVEEIHQAFNDYRKTQFGGWPFKRYDHVHPREKGRFASYSDGRKEERPVTSDKL